MDEIGDYLYVIIFVGIIIFNILKTFRKQQKPVPIPDFPEDHPYSTDEKDDSWENPAPVLQKEPMTHQPMVHQSMQSHSKTKSTVKNKSPKKAVNLLNERKEENNIPIAFNNTDDARQAFIYSEIWNRKY